MKLPFTVQSPSAFAWLRRDKRSKAQNGTGMSASEVGTWNLQLGTCPRQGVALVITLIMLSIITFMAVTFLVLSQRERSATTGTTDTKIARNASDAGFARVCSELLTEIMLQTNSENFDLQVSTNYINYNGFVDGLPPNPTNVNYDYEVGATHPPFAGGAVEWERNIADLLYNPRPPVFVVTNTGTGVGEFRFYYDINRNGRYDRNGNWPIVVTDAAGNPSYLSTNNGQIILVATNFNGWVFSNSFVGDPEWIGQLERPTEMHSADNRFIARYAYVVIPASKTLDLNYIHNRAKRITATGEGFLRNQGVGPWEINLAAFLADLNTNAWWNPNSAGLPGYTYNLNSLILSTGAAFTNANDLLNYRYNSNYNTLTPARALFTNNAIPLASANIDAYSDGPLMLTTTNPVGGPNVDNPALPWSGADNTNHFFSDQDFFDPAKLPASFRTTLANLGTSNDTYNAYTFFRMLAQLGGDSGPELNKLNINYKNTDDGGHVIPNMETNLISWTPTDFFTNAANRMLAQITNQIGYPLTVANIPLYPTNYYTPAVHRILQLAANIYDATTNQTVPLVGAQTNAFFPTVFRPVFFSKNGNVSINGYQEVVKPIPLSFDYWDLARASNNPGTLAGINIYGVPWVIGAKKGFPNFNESSMETAISVSRKLRLRKQSPGDNPVIEIKQMFEIGVSNILGIEAWNSYLSAYPRGLTLSVSNEVGISMTNQLGVNLIPGGWVTFAPFMPTPTNIPPNTWKPFINQQNLNGSMLVPLQGGFVFLTNATYVDSPPGFIANDPAAFRTDASQPMPELFLTTTNRVQYSLVDTTVNPHRVVDYVNLEKVSTVDISDVLRNQSQCSPNPNAPLSDRYVYWCVQAITGGSGYVPGFSVNRGVNFQIGVSEGVPSNMKASDWAAQGADPNNFSQIQKFQNFVNGNSGPGSDTNMMQTPFNPTAYFYQHFTWQANDPLVHYTVGDLTDPTNAAVDTISNNLANIGSLNTRYRPWGGYLLNQSQNDPTVYSVALKDPGVTQSGDWDFCTNKFPGLGWLGRVHRGTPWQTVYMKSPALALRDWQEWGGDATFLTNGTASIQDATLSLPVSDYQLFDVFTTALNDNATRGKLDINQTNLAAWTAVFGGVNVITNSVSGLTGPFTISPAGVYDPSNNPSLMYQIWQGINQTRGNTDTNFTIFPNHVFQHLGDVLATPQLSWASPFLNTNGTGGVSGTGLASLGANGINDEIMERIPQQVMSLLTLNQSPRFVIYSFGQTLHPADHSLVIGGTFNGLCTNYQITAESATRAVVRVDGSPDPQYIDGRVDSQGRSYPPHLVVEQFNVLGPD